MALGSACRAVTAASAEHPPAAFAPPLSVPPPPRTEQHSRPADTAPPRPLRPDQLHNETGNIWTHGGAFLAFLYVFGEVIATAVPNQAVRPRRAHTRPGYTLHCADSPPPPRVASALHPTPRMYLHDPNIPRPLPSAFTPTNSPGRRQVGLHLLVHLRGRCAVLPLLLHLLPHPDAPLCGGVRAHHHARFRGDRAAHMVRDRDR